MSTAIAKTKKVKAPKKTSDRKRPNKQFIEKMVAFRGFMTGNEKLQLKTLTLKNVMQRINNKSMSDDVNNVFNSQDVKDLMVLINSFVKEANIIIKRAN